MPNVGIQKYAVDRFLRKIMIAHGEKIPLMVEGVKVYVPADRAWNIEDVPSIRRVAARLAIDILRREV